MKTSNRRSLAMVTLVAFTATACGAEISYGVRPLARPAMSAAEHCVQDQRLEVATGTAEVEWSEPAGGNFTRDVREYQKGLVFYRGGQRLTPTTTLALLNDRELQTSYGRKLEELESRYSRSRSAAIFGFVGFFGSAAALLTYSSLNGNEAPTERDKTVALSLAGVALVAIPFLLFGTLTMRKRHQKWDAYRELLFEASVLDRLQYRIDEFNGAASRACNGVR